MSKKSDYLEFFSQAVKMLNSTGNRLAKINMVLVMLIDHLNIRNPVILIRDNVTNTYTMELAPELTQGEMNLASEKLGNFISRRQRRFYFEQMHLGKEAADIPLAPPVGAAHDSMALVSFPVMGQDKSVPLGILMGFVVDGGPVAEKAKAMKILAGHLGLYLDSTGSFPRRSFESAPEEFPMIMEGIVGESRVIKQVGETIRAVATSRASVFIRGQSGTGKELIARNIHKQSLRSRSPFVGLNCAAISEHLLLNELFGHEKGAFTGATSSMKGRFESADGGTLFLDEIGETSLNFQAKLLRVLQEGEFERLGSSRTIKVDVRIVCATNADIESLVRKRLFREDLYYRLNVLPIWAPSLDERREDIPILARYFLANINREYGKNIIISDEQAQSLATMDWPGNVRQLESFIHRAFLNERNGGVDISSAISSGGELFAKEEVDEKNAGGQDLAAEEKRAIVAALEEARGVQVKAAGLLGITLRQLRYRIAKYNIKVRKVGLRR